MKFIDLVRDQDVEIISEGIEQNIITGITCDSREVKDGWSFIALKGTKFNGISFIPEAISAGATAIFCDQDLDKTVIPRNVAFAKLKNGRVTMALLVRKFYGNPDLNLDIVGITGTNGKTTTASIIQQLVELSGRSCGLIGSVVNIIGEQRYVSRLTTPDSPTLYRFLKSLLDVESKILAIEVSSHSLELARVCGMRFKFGVFTNLTQDHLDFHCDMESYFNAKSKLFLQSEVGLINADDHYGQRLLSNNKFISYGIEHKADYMASDIVLKSCYTTFQLKTKFGISLVVSPLVGKFNVYNLLAALAVLIEYGFQLDDLLALIPKIQNVIGRMDRLNYGQEFEILIDYAHTPDAINKVLEESRRLLVKHGRLHVLFGCGGNRDKGKRSVMANIVSKYADVIWHTSDNPRWEDPNTILDDGAIGIVDEIRLDKLRYHRIVDRHEAIISALNNCSNGDLLLLLGKGHESYQEIRGTKYAHSDYEIVKKTLLGF